MSEHSFKTPQSTIAIPAKFREVPYDGARYPGVEGPLELGCE